MSDNGENWDDPEWVLSKLADEDLTTFGGRDWGDYRRKLEGIFAKVSERLRGDRVFLLKVVEEYGEALDYASDELKKDREVVLLAVKNYGYALQYASAELKKDREIVLQAVKNNGNALLLASDELKKDREFVLQAVKNNGGALLYASAELKKDREVVLQAVKNYGLALEYASAELKKDREIVLQAVKNNGNALLLASDELKMDRGFVLQAVKNNGYALQYASAELKKDREFVLQAVKNYGLALEYASAELKKDREIVLQAVKNNGNALLLASDELKKDREFVLQAVKNNGYALQYASAEWKRDLEIALAAAAQNERALAFVDDDIRAEVKTRLVPMNRKPRPRKVLADRPIGDDQLGLKLMAYAIADILASKNLSTPFVTGVFGDWGSGKSFLMYLMEQRFGQIMSQDLVKGEFQDIKDYPFCGHIYTVHFNAWTFSKDELWASLMYRILYDLNEQLDLEAHIRSLPGDFCMHGVDYIELKRKLRSENMKKAFKKYTKEGLDGLSYEPKKDGKVSKELIRVMNKAYHGDVEELPGKIRELEKLNARINRKNWRYSVWKTTEEHFRSELKAFREGNPSVESINDMLHSVGILKRWSKLLLGGIKSSPASLLFIILFLACAIAVTVIVLTVDLGELSDKMTAFYSSIVAFLSLGVGTVVKTIRKAQKALDGLGVTGAILSADAAVQEVEKSLAAMEAMEEGKPGESDLDKRHRLECEISAMKNRRWLVEGDSLHDQVRNRLNLGNYKDRLGVVHQAQEDLEMLSRAMDLAYKDEISSDEVSYEKSDRGETPETSEQSLEQEERHSEEVDDSSNKEELSWWVKLLLAFCPISGCVGCFKIWLFVLPQFVSLKFSNFWKSCIDIIGKFVTAVSDVKTKIASSRFCRVISWGIFYEDDFEIDDMREVFGVKFEERKGNNSNPKERKDERRFPRGKPRIVLFIDDLDRCPPEKVVDVIEALQLLLDRTDVFVAILALDVRYVTRALEKKYKDVLIKDSEPSGIQYLQKIIQLPFSVPRMSPDGIKNYFEHQLSQKGRDEEKAAKNVHENSSEATKSDEVKESELPRRDKVNEEDGGGDYRNEEDRPSHTMLDVDEPVDTSREGEHSAVEIEKGGLSAQETRNTTNDSPDNAGYNPSNPTEIPSSGLESGDNDSSIDQSGVVVKQEENTSDQVGTGVGGNNEDNTSSKEQQESDYIFANEEQEFSEVEVEMITVAGRAARINPRSGRMIANVFKVLKNIWADPSIPEPQDCAKQAIMHLVAFASSYPLLMGRILANLEDELISDAKAETKTLGDFVNIQLETCSKTHWSFRKISDQSWGDVTLGEIGYANVRLLRSCSFVGDHTAIGDAGSEDQQYGGVKFVRGKNSISLIPDDVATCTTCGELLALATKLSLFQNNHTFAITEAERQDLNENRKSVAFEVNGMRLSKDQFKQTPTQNILFVDVHTTAVVDIHFVNVEVKQLQEQDMDFFMV